MKLGPYLLGPNDTPENGIYCGDARELAKAIPDESVDLIFTDPPYPKEYLPLYEWLAEEAARILRPSGICVVMAGHSYLPSIFGMMGTHLDYHWTLCLEQPGPTAAMHHRRISTSWKPLLMYVKGQYAGTWLRMDRIPSSYREKGLHIWQQNENACQLIVRLFDGGIVFDPFSGSGTVAAVCKMLHRNYLAFDIDRTACDLARSRLDIMQPFLFMPAPQQLEMMAV